VKFNILGFSAPLRLQFLDQKGFKDLFLDLKDLKIIILDEAKFQFLRS